MKLPGSGWLPGAVALFLAASAAGASQGLVLEPGVSVERPLAAGGVDSFGFQLEAGKPWRLSVEQLGIDVVVEVDDPRGRSLLAIDSPLGREGTESLLLMPAVDGFYGAVVRSEKQGAPDGHFEIRLEELPAATPVDRLRLRAEAAATEAGRLFAGHEDGGTERAVVRLREALDAWRELGDRPREAWTSLLLGSYSEVLGDYREAVASYGRSLATWRQLEDASGLAVVLDRLGLGYHQLGDHRQALRYLEEALALRRRLDRPEREAETRNHLCLVLQRSGGFHAAGECYEKALTLARELDDTELEARVLNNLGGIHANLGEPAAALEHYQRALDLRRAIGDELGEAATLNNLGALLRGVGDVEEALLDYGRALAIFERLDDRYWQARTLNNVGSAYLSLGALERALAYLLRALPLRRQVGDRSGETMTLRNLGWAYSRLEEPGKALAFYRKALDNDLAAGDRRGEATTRKLLGELQMEQHQGEAARGELELALASLQQMGNRSEEAEVLELLSRVHLGAGEPGKARALAAQALEGYRAVRGLAGEVSTLATLARVERRLGRPEAAREHLEAALEALDDLHGRLGDPNRRASFLASQREVHELYTDVLMELHRQRPAAGYDRTALEASERAHSQSLLALLEGAGAGLGRGVEPELAERLRAAERRLTAKTRRQLEVLGREHTPDEALAAEQELYSALTGLENVRAEIRRRSPRYASLSRPWTLDATAVRSLLDDDTVLLEFLLGEDRSFLWRVTPASVTAYELPPRRTIEALAWQVHQQVGAIHQRTAPIRETLDALGRMLLGPVAERLADERLVVVADGALHLVPFAALTLPGARQPVLTRHEVVYLPSAAVLASHRRGSAGASKPAAAATLAILADPIFDRRDPRLGRGSTERAEESSGAMAPAETPTRRAALLELGELRRLPHTGREAEAIAALVPAGRRLLATGAAARRSLVVDGELAAYRILHFATHGLIHPVTPELSGLVLSRLDADGGELDGFLGLYDVSNLELSAELVVLSGCHTALGKQIRGEGLVGLTRGFMYAGVPRVVASFWQVRDEATAELMARFYRAMLAEGMPAAAALRAAQLALRQDRRFRDPFYWAAFALQGDWQ